MHDTLRLKYSYIIASGRPAINRVASQKYNKVSEMFGHNNQFILPTQEHCLFLDFSSIPVGQWDTILFAFHTEIWNLIDMAPETEGDPTTTYTACGLYLVHHANQEWIQAVQNQGSFTFHDGNETFHLPIRTPPKDWAERKVKVLTVHGLPLGEHMQVLQDNLAPFGDIIQVRPTNALHLKGCFQYQVSHQYEVVFMMKKDAKFWPNKKTTASGLEIFINFDRHDTRCIFCSSTEHRREDCQDPAIRPCEHCADTSHPTSKCTSPTAN
jgi:hypothetical protein